MPGDVHIEYGHSKVLGRYCSEAWVFNSTPRPDVIPRPHDACVTGMAQLGMNITGLEEVDGMLYVQSWVVRGRMKSQLPRDWVAALDNQFDLTTDPEAPACSAIMSYCPRRASGPPA